MCQVITTFLTLVHHHDRESSFPTQPVSLVKEFELSVVLLVLLKVYGY